LHRRDALRPGDGLFHDLGPMDCRRTPPFVASAKRGSEAREAVRRDQSVLRNSRPAIRANAEIAMRYYLLDTSRQPAGLVQPRRLSGTRTECSLSAPRTWTEAKKY
jgi:hypothetical protein